MRNSLRTVLAVLSTALALSAQAAWVQWPVNGHYYDVVLIAGGDRSWAAASAQAQAMIAPNGAQGHLATITSAAENAFVFSLADSPAFWVLDIANNNEGPYIGGYQVGGSEPAGGWRWQKGEPWNFTAWAAGEPNNFNGNEHFANLYSPGAGRAATWNDVPSDPSSVVVAYVVEAPWVTGGDLAKDFSSTTNPTQKWRLEKNLGVPFTIRQLDFWSNGGNQIAWADQPFNLNAHVPLWMRLTAIDTPGGSFDAQVGDIVMHGAVNSRTGSVNTSAIFTSNFVGPAIISGHTWLTRQIGRTMEWQIYKNGVFLTKGTLTGNGSTTRANPVLFSSGTGGPAVLNTNLVIGDKVELRYFSTDNLPDVAGVNFTISSLALSNFTIAPSGVVSGNQ
ncbi:MAG: lectin-like protein, partial [Fimbriimonadaceae bacterium]